MRKALLKSISIILVLMMCGCSGIKGRIDHVKAYGDVDTRLADAIASENLEGVKEALAEGANVDSSYVTYPELREVIPLEYASEHQLNWHIPGYLLDNGANLDFRMEEGSTPLSSAAYRNDVDSCRYFLSYGADIEYTTRDGKAPLDCAADAGAEDAIKLLLEEGAVITRGTLDRVLKGEYGDGYKHYGAVRLIVEELVSKHEKVKMEDIVFAAVTGDSEKVISLGSEGKLNKMNLFLVGNNVAAFGNSEALEFCIQNGFTLTKNEEYNKYEEPLDVAAMYGNIETVRWILDHWEEYGKGSDPKYTAIALAVSYKQYELVSYLLSLGTYLKLDGEAKILYQAVRNKDAKMVKLLLEGKPAISEFRLAQLISDSTMYNDYESTKLLLQAGDLSEEGKRKMWRFAYTSMDILKLCEEYDELPKDGALLVYAVKDGNYDVARYLIERGVDVNAPLYAEKIGAPIENAIRFGFLDIVKLLVENGADVNYESNGFGSMLMLASKGSANITQYLIDNGADLNWQLDENGYTALMGAVEREKIFGVKVLLNAGADVSIKNNEGLTAVDLAEKSGNKELIRLFDI